MRLAKKEKIEKEEMRLQAGTCYSHVFDPSKDLTLRLEFYIGEERAGGSHPTGADTWSYHSLLLKIMNICMNLNLKIYHAGKAIHDLSEIKSI